MPLIEYKSRRFSDDVMEVIGHANDLIEDYAAQGLALTLRQLYYRFVAADLLANTLQSYNRLGDIVNNARLAGLMDWEAIEDRGRNLIQNAHWEDPAEIVKACASQFELDKWAGQECRVEVWVEKQALEAVVGQAAELLDCPYFSCKGYTSQSEMWRAARRFEGYHEQDQMPVIVHLGDHDPSGIDMTRDIRERLNDLFDVEVEVCRIALNMNQIREYRPPPNPAKMSDSRARGYIERFETRSSWELDALEPAVLRELIQFTIRGYMDEDLFKEHMEAEAEARRVLTIASEKWGDITRFMEGSE